MKRRNLLLAAVAAVVLTVTPISAIAQNADNPNPEPPRVMVAQSQVSINTASAAALQKLNGIGPALSQRIVDYREANGPFTSIDQITDVKGIGATRLEQLKPHLSL